MKSMWVSGIVELLNCKSVVSGKFQSFEHHLLFYFPADGSFIVTFHTEEEIDASDNNETDGTCNECSSCDDLSFHFVRVWSAIGVLLSWHTGIGPDKVWIGGGMMRIAKSGNGH